MNRAIKDATVKRFHYEAHDQLRSHLAAFVEAHNYPRRLKTLTGLTPYQAICKACTKSRKDAASAHTTKCRDRPFKADGIYWGGKQRIDRAEVLRRGDAGETPTLIASAVGYSRMQV